MKKNCAFLAYFEEKAYLCKEYLGCEERLSVG